MYAEIKAYVLREGWVESGWVDRVDVPCVIRSEERRAFKGAARLGNYRVEKAKLRGNEGGRVPVACPARYIHAVKRLIEKVAKVDEGSKD